MKKLLTIVLVLLALTSCNEAQKTIMFDLSHSQCTDVYVGHETYPLVVPAYTEMAQQLGAELVVNEEAEITPQLLKGSDVLVMLSPLSNKLQKDLTEYSQIPRKKKNLRNRLRNQYLRNLRLTNKKSPGKAPGSMTIIFTEMNDKTIKRKDGFNEQCL